MLEPAWLCTTGEESGSGYWNVSEDEGRAVACTSMDELAIGLSDVGLAPFVTERLTDLVSVAGKIVELAGMRDETAICEKLLPPYPLALVVSGVRDSTGVDTTLLTLVSRRTPDGTVVYIVKVVVLCEEARLSTGEVAVVSTSVDSVLLDGI